MPQVRRVQIPDGPHRDLVESLRELHLVAGLPSVRWIARETRALSHDTVHRVLICAGVPTWGTLELVVEALGGDVGEFRRLWVAAQRGLEFGGD
jgi:hypothetical protein